MATPDERNAIRWGCVLHRVAMHNFVHVSNKAQEQVWASGGSSTLTGSAIFFVITVLFVKSMESFKLEAGILPLGNLARNSNMNMNHVNMMPPGNQRMTG
ncbi:hypothetical protein Patl1_19084 [Pistacia atlantica]|uniref:Uncharacterized protein n=1 Tax=Pistacia atlantica TaxID=434234 RepID=A0ACC1BYW0_9ROSI|nr:hypothetical protein Patl1_19084 [Pistacia atlantica]